jgi:hypothetical protein
MGTVPVPIATTPPTAYGASSYLPMSSFTNPMASNYHAPTPTNMSVPNQSTQLNAYGAPLYSSNAWGTNNQVAKTNTATGALLSTPQTTQQAAAPADTTGAGDTGGTVDYTAMIQPAMDALTQAEQTQQTATANMIGDINTNQTTQTGILNSNLQTQQGDINTARTNQKNITQNAEAQARQAYSEIAQGIQSRFGGSTGTGAFATELAGRATNNNLAQFQTNLASAMQQLDNSWTQVQQVHDNNLASLNEQTQKAIHDAQANLDTNLNNIAFQKSALQSQKADMINQAIKDYQNTVLTIHNTSTQFAQTLAANLVSAGQSIQKAMANAQAIVGQGQAGATNATAGTRALAQGYNGVSTPVGSYQYPSASTLPTDTWLDQYGNVTRKNPATI